MPQYRQGDVLVELVALQPAVRTAQWRREDALILAHGEVTGHAHRLTAPVETVTIDDVCYFVTLTEAGVSLSHDEHGCILMESTAPGMAYRVTRQREYSPGVIRNVAD